MKGPSTYTGEDVVELSLHGSPLVLDMVVRFIVRLGARPAMRGEFTRRAFLSGRLDLLQAEAVIDLIEAASPLAAEEARARLDRSLSRRIREISDGLIDLLAELEAYIDFDEDEVVPPPDPVPLLQDLLARMNAFKKESETGRIARHGLRTVITGKPNVGKSTLFNTLLRTERTIVTPYPGTTRDTVDESLILGNLAFLLCDTAGIRANPDPIEEEGIRRTRTKIMESDLVIALLDGSSELDHEDETVLQACKRKDTLIVVNKADLGLVLDPDTGIPESVPGRRLTISAKTGQGMDELRRAIAEAGEKRVLTGAGDTFGSLNSRGLLLMEAAAIPVENLLASFDRGEPVRPEIVSLEVRQALEYLQEITGERVDEAVLDRIFSRFCVGK
jgi:tRNA modification GTPase